MNSLWSRALAMNSQANVILVIIDQVLEEKVIDTLRNAEIDISGRYLALHHVPKNSQERPILITTADLVESAEVVAVQREFLAIILLVNATISGMMTVSLAELEELPNLIAGVTVDATPELVQRHEDDLGLQIVGVVPRVGVRTLREAINSTIQQSSYLVKEQLFREPIILYCSELDDDSILRLLSVINEERGKSHQKGVLFTKVPETRRALDRVKAIERELQGCGISLIFTLAFDEEAQVLGELSKGSLRALQPLFDWIEKAN